MYFKSHISIDPINAALAQPDYFWVSSWPPRISVAFQRSRELEANLSFSPLLILKALPTSSWFLPHWLTLLIFPVQLLNPKICQHSTVPCRDAPLGLNFLVSFKSHRDILHLSALRSHGTGKLEKQLALIFHGKWYMDITVSCPSSEKMPGGARQGARTPKGSTGDCGDGKVQEREGKAPAKIKQTGSSGRGQV